jgi:hypothetical protein
VVLRADGRAGCCLRILDDLRSKEPQTGVKTEMFCPSIVDSSLVDEDELHTIMMMMIAGRWW